MKESVTTPHAPLPIAPYSPAIKSGQTVYLSGQIALDPVSGNLIGDDFKTEAHQVFKNLLEVVKAAGGSPEHIVKLNVYITDFADYKTLNTIMTEYFEAPYPARAVVQVSALPMNARIEVDGIVVLV